MREAGATHHFVSTVDDLAWILNLRGADVSYNPVFLAHLLIAPDTATLFIAAAKVDATLAATLAADGVRLAPYEAGRRRALRPARERDPAARSEAGDARHARAHPRPGGRGDQSEHPGQEPQERGRGGARAPGDGRGRRGDVRVLRLVRGGARRPGAAQASLTELTIDAKLTEARAKRPGYVGPSFATIAAFNANGAMPHYRATRESHASLADDGLLLIDSGAQYRGGTTDITRMWPVGRISAAQRRDVTLVLRGTIALSRARFPRGTLSPMLDTIARVPLWEHGLDYGHGTGHGVGYFLNVHEGPQSFSRVIPDATMAMQPGMITSVEPGLYRPGQWGVRVENLVLSVPAAGHAERVRRVPRVRDADPVPDRCPLPRALAAARRRDRLAECVPRHGPRATGAAGERRCAGLADAAHRAARLVSSPLRAPPDAASGPSAARRSSPSGAVRPPQARIRRKPVSPRRGGP